MGAGVARKRRGEYGFIADANELTSFFQEYESKIGLKSSQRETIHLNLGKGRTRLTIADGNTRAPSGIADDRNDDQADADDARRGRQAASKATFLDMNDGLTARPRGGSQVSPSPDTYDQLAAQVPELSRAKRVYRALRHMAESGQGLLVTVLWRLYGPRNGATEHAIFGALSPLASYTSAAIEAREGLALEATSDVYERAGERARKALATRRDEIAREFWQAASSEARCLAQAERAKAPKRDELRKRAAGWRTFQGRLLDAYAVDGTIRVTTGAIANTDRFTTVSDAIRWKLRNAPPGLPAVDKVAHTTAREQFVSAVKVQANQLRKDAHQAYRSAKAALQ